MVLDFTTSQIVNYKGDRDKSAENMLDYRKTANISTVDLLYDALLSIGRQHVAQYIYDSICEKKTDV